MYEGGASIELRQRGNCLLRSWVHIQAHLLALTRLISFRPCTCYVDKMLCIVLPYRVHGPPSCLHWPCSSQAGLAGTPPSHGRLVLKEGGHGIQPHVLRWYSVSTATWVLWCWGRERDGAKPWDRYV